jgi:putative Mg2+ transporter-C (MgtC) family protein
MDIGLKTILIRVGFALAAGFVLGWEREGHGRAAGLKTMILACVASCLAMILSETFFLESALRSAPGWLPDRSRLAAGILTGIGFLGAGAILRHGNNIRGVTTGAVLWYATIIGMACGSGRLELAGLGTVIALGVLYLLPIMENRIARDGFARLTVVLDAEQRPEVTIEKLLREKGMHITGNQHSLDLKNKERALSYELKYRRSRNANFSSALIEQLAGEPGVRSVRWE